MIEFREGCFGVTEEAEAQSRQLPDVSESRVAREHFLEIGQGGGIILTFERIPGPHNLLTHINCHATRLRRYQLARHGAADAGVFEADLSHLVRTEQIAAIDDDRACEQRAYALEIRP